MKKFSVRTVCRAGIIAAIYAALTLSLSQFAFGPVQIRPAEALTLLPLLYTESVPALFIGCMIANLLSPYGVADIVAGSLITLISAVATYFVPRFVKKPLLRAVIGGIFPIALNALVLPLMWMFVGGEGAFWANLLSLGATQLIWVYALGLPLYLVFNRYSSKPHSPIKATNKYALIQKQDKLCHNNATSADNNQEAPRKSD